MPNKNSTITHYTTTDLLLSDQTIKTRFLVLRLGKETIILRLPWLQQHNPDIDWEKGMFKFRTDPALVRICTIMTKVWAMMKGMLFEKCKPQMVKLPKATIEEVFNEEPLPLTNPDAELIGPKDHSSEFILTLSWNHLNPNQYPKWN